MLKLIAIQSNGDGDEEEGDGDEEEGNEIKDNDHSIPYYCFSDLPEITREYNNKRERNSFGHWDALVQGEDVAARGHVLLFSADPDNSQTLVPEVYSKELKGAISALASLQGHLKGAMSALSSLQGHLKGAMSALSSLQSLLLIASGPKISWF